MAADRKAQQPGLRFWALSTLIALGLIAALLPAPPAAAAKASRVVPTVGSYKASGRGDPPRYSVRAQAKRRSGRTTLSAQVSDSCGGFATFPRIAVSSGPKGSTFSARVGAVAISGRWTTATRIEGSVKTPCARRQDYVMTLSG
jgi:hypothetical protein